MSFYIYDVIFLVAFSLAVAIFLYKRRKKVQREGILYLYRTQIGVKFINYIGGKYKKTLKVLAVISVICGYLLMIGMIYLLVKIVSVYLFQPEIVRAIKIPPLLPLFPYLPEAFNVTFLPPFYFTYWIIAIAVVAIFHEFAHGIYMKLYGVKIKSTGFGFLGPFLAAFVEQDEEDMEKKSRYRQIVILSAGVFSNFILALVFLLVLSGFFVLAYVPAGAMFNTYASSPVFVNTITGVGGITIDGFTNQNILYIINQNNLTNNLIFGSNGYTLNLIKITANGETYYLSVENLKLQLEAEKEYVLLYNDLPAINVAMKGSIIGVDDYKISDQGDLVEVLEDLNPGDEIKIITKYEDDILEYEIILGEDPNQEGRAMIGIGYDSRTKLLSQVTDMFNFFKKPGTNYEPRFNADIILFIYHLIWWLALINLSVALVNMWPVAIFDGGRMFMLTIWAITGSKKVGEIAFKVATYAILISLLVLMFGWAFAFI
ncbi:MAG: site-2 protease family protein [archaeon]